MTPAIQNFDIFKGAKWEKTLLFKDPSEGTPIDLTGLGPFVFSVKNQRTDELIFNATITSDYDAAGSMVILISPEQSDLLIAGSQIAYGLRDALNNPYMAGILSCKYFAPDAS